jgi:hypothetical protein
MPPAYKMPMWPPTRTAKHRALHNRLRREFLAAGCSRRASLALASGGYDVETARGADDSELLRLPNFGKVSLREFRERQGRQ